MLQLKQFYLNNFQVSSFIEILSIGLAILIPVICLIYVYWLINAIMMPPTQLITIDKPRKIFSLYKTDLKNMALISIIKKVFMAFILVFLERFPKVQLISINVFNLVLLSLLVLYQPLRKRIGNIFKISGEICSFIAHLLLLVIVYYSGSLEPQQIQRISQLSMILFIISFVFELAGL